MNKEKFQVLVVTMKQDTHKLLDKMNIKSAAVFGNQTNKMEEETFSYNGNKIEWYSWNEKGVGLNRNNLLMRSTADIVLFADDDVTYVDDYAEKIVKEFELHPQSDVIIFNVPSVCKDERQKDYIAKKWKKLTLLNCFRHGTFRIAVRREEILKKNIFFSLLFGGGAKYSAGEDSLFIADCIRKKLKVYESPVIIGNVSHEESTWFKGYSEKYFKDKGAFYACFSKYFSYLWCLQFAVRRRNLFVKEMSFQDACKFMFQGIKEFKRK